MSRTEHRVRLAFRGFVVVDPYNDFISEGGKLWRRLSQVAIANQCVPHMLQVVNGAREKGLAVPCPDAKVSVDVESVRVRHLGWRNSPSTVRFAAELGYEVTVVRDATASFSDEDMHAALDITIPNYASAIVTTSELLDSIGLTAAQAGARGD